MVAFLRRALQCYGSQGHKRKRKKDMQRLCSVLCFALLLLLVLPCVADHSASGLVDDECSETRFAFKGWSPEEAKLDGIGYAPAAIPLGRYIFVLGGVLANSTEATTLQDFVLHQTGRNVNVFDFFANTMRPATQLPADNRAFAGGDAVGVRLVAPAVGANSAVQVRSDLYLLGCCNAIPEHVRVQVDLDVGRDYLLSVQRLRLYATAHPGADDVTVRVESWRLPPDTVLRYNASCVSDGDDLVYIVGGVDAVTGAELDTVAQYNVTSRTMVDAVVSLGRRAVNPAVLSHSELVYIVGGFSRRTKHGNVTDAAVGETSEAVMLMDTAQRVVDRQRARYWPHSLGWTAPQLFMYERTMLVIGNTYGRAYDRLVYWDDLTVDGAPATSAGLPFCMLGIGFAPARRDSAVVAVPLTANTMRFYLFGGQVPAPQHRGTHAVGDIFSGVLSVPPRPVPKELYVEGFAYHPTHDAVFGESSAHVPNNGENVTIIVNGYIPVWYNTTFKVLLSGSVFDACPGLVPGNASSADVGASRENALHASNCSLVLAASPQCAVPLVHIARLGTHNTRRELIDGFDMHGQVFGKVEVVSVGWLTLVGSLRDGLLHTRIDPIALPHVRAEPAPDVFYPQVFLFVCFSRGPAAVGQAAALAPHSSVALRSSFYYLLNGIYPFILSPVTEWVPNPQPTPGPRPDVAHHWTTLTRLAAIALLPVALLLTVALRRRRDDDGTAAAEEEQRLLSDPDVARHASRDVDGGAVALLGHKYRVLRRLGRGSFSVVYLVQRVCDGAEFALKHVQCPDGVDPREAIKECEVAYLLQGHPSVVTIVDMFLSYHFDAQLPATPSRGRAAERRLSLVMSYHEDGDLGRWVLRRKATGQPIAEPTLVSIAAQVLSVLCHMHSRDPPIVHRDLKPENILLSRRAYADVDDSFLPLVITDFGLARFMDKTFCETGVGSLPYMAPECWQRRYSTKVDLWALGCILYAVATRSVESNNVKIMFSESARPGFARKLRTELRQTYGYSKAFASLVTLLLKVNPDARPSAAEALRYIDRRPSAPQRASTPTPTTVVDEPGRDEAEPCVCEVHVATQSVENGCGATTTPRLERGATPAASRETFFDDGAVGVRYELVVSFDHVTPAEASVQQQQQETGNDK